MTKSLFFLLVCCSCNLFCQKNSEIITYSIQPIAFQIESKGEQKLLTEKIMKIAESQTFSLRFIGSVSHFFQNPKMLTGMDEMENQLAAATFTSDSHYIDIKKRLHISKSSEGLLLTEPFEDKWIITGETKKIGEYSCYAVHQEVTYKGFDGSLKTKKIICWFAPSLPYSFGPVNYHGLPGLILELTDRYTTYVASKIQILQNMDETIDWPKGTILSKEEFDRSRENIKKRAH